MESQFKPPITIFKTITNINSKIPYIKTNCPIDVNGVFSKITITIDQSDLINN